MSEIQEAVLAIKSAILKAQYNSAKVANSNQLSLYFGIGKYVSQNSRHEFWGTNAIHEISRLLQIELPGLRGFSERNIKSMRQFYEEWASVLNRPPVAADLEQSETISNTALLVLDRKDDSALAMEDFLSISFSHHMEILRKTKTLEERVFYIHNSAKLFWSKYVLRDYLKEDLFHHQSTMPNNFSKTMQTPETAIKAMASFKDEYLLDFINVEELDVANVQDIDERVIEKSIVNNITKFIMKMGPQFSFIGNQQRIVVGDEEFFIDLLFFNRTLHCLVAIELKKGDFKPSYLGQLSFYLSALDKTIKQKDENPSIGIVLCKEVNKSVVEIAIQDYKSPMGVATYRTQSEIPAQYRNALPNIDEMKKLLESDDQ